MILAGAPQVKAPAGARTGRLDRISSGYTGLYRKMRVVRALGISRGDEFAFRFLEFVLDAFEYFFAMHRDTAGCVDTHPHLVTLHAQNRDRDFVTDHERFTHPPRQNQ